MTRFALTAVAMFGMATIAARDASALTAKTRLCVQSARQNARNAVATVRAKALEDQRKAIITCFGPGGGCAEKCQSDQTLCLDNTVTGPRTLCDTSNVPGDGTDSCREQFDAAVRACRDKFPGRTDAEIDLQLECLTGARATRFICSQGCAAAVQSAQDTCSVDFAECLERCG